MEEVRAEVETEAMVGEHCMKHDLATTTSQRNIPDTRTEVCENQEGHSNMLDMVKELAKLIVSHLDKFLGNYRTKQFEDHNSSETKITCFNQNKEAPNLHHQNVEEASTEVETEAMVGELLFFFLH